MRWVSRIGRRAVVWVDAYARERKLAHIGFAQHHRTCIAQTLHHGRIVQRRCFACTHYATGHGGFARHVDVVFEGDAHAVQRTKAAACLRLSITVLRSGVCGIGV